MNYLGYHVDNSLFKDKSMYFRNALVRSNYFDENLLLSKNNDLHSKDLIVKGIIEGAYDERGR